jgi:hypothetical protein
MNKNKNAVTLVEIIITVAILAILWVVWYLSLTSYLVTVRDSTRLVELENIEWTLWWFVLKSWHYPEPTNWIDVTYSWAVIWTQWTFWNSVATQIWYSNDVVDPLSKNEYTYSIKNTKKEYSIAWVFEERPGLVFNNTVSPTANAEKIWEKKWLALVKWNYNWEIISILINGVTNILAIPSIISSDLSSHDLQDIINNNKYVYNEYGNLPASYTWTIYNVDNDIDFSANNLVVFSWSISSLTQSYNQISFLQDLYLAYSWSILSTELSINQIDKDDLFWLEPSSKIRDVACDIINFKLKYFVECWWVDFITFFVINVLHIDIENLPWTKITAVYQDHNWNFVFWTDEWLVFYDWTNWVVYTKQDSWLVHNLITSITQDTLWNYWIWTYNWISKLTLWDYVNKADDIWVTIWSNKLTSTHVQYIYTDNDWVVWIWTNGWATSYNGDIWTTYTKNWDWLTHNNITAIYTDRQWHVWFWTNSKWVDKFTFSDSNCNNFWRNDKHDDEDDHDWHDSDHDWNDQDYHCNRNWYDDESWHHENDDHDWHEENWHHYDWSEDTVLNYKDSKLPNNKVTYIYQDSSEKMWIWTEWWIWITSNYWSTWTKYTVANTSWWLIGNNIKYIFQDTAWNIWVWTTVWLSKFNWTTWTTYSTWNWLLWNTIYLINQDWNGNIIIFSDWWLDTIDSSGNIIT